MGCSTVLRPIFFTIWSFCKLNVVWKSVRQMSLDLLIRRLCLLNVVWVPVCKTNFIRRLWKLNFVWTPVCKTNILGAAYSSDLKVDCCLDVKQRQKYATQKHCVWNSRHNQKRAQIVTKSHDDLLTKNSKKLYLVMR